ncbi:MAG: pyrroline-5-carboxylate reductase [Nitrospinae bacterium]|nr:pyrroline-5-carboxylate reductase [Nitrospinota bacterium]
MLNDKRLVFIGGGNMGEAIIKGITAAHLVSAQQITVTDIIEKRLAYLRDTYAIQTMMDNAKAVAQADLVLLALKPQDIVPAIHAIAPVVDQRQLVISIAAGISIGTIEAAFENAVRVVRVMPNTPALVLAGAAALCRGRHATPDDLDVARALFDAVGKTVIVSETLMDAVTGLSASGPAYIFVLIEALADGGVKMGLSREVALTLAAQTVYGSAKLLLETGLHPGELKDRVASPGGTTMAGLHALETRAFRAAVIEAVERATQRSQELGRG